VAKIVSSVRKEAKMENASKNPLSAEGEERVVDPDGYRGMTG